MLQFNPLIPISSLEVNSHIEYIISGICETGDFPAEVIKTTCPQIPSVCLTNHCEIITTCRIVLLLLYLICLLGYQIHRVAWQEMLNRLEHMIAFLFFVFSLFFSPSVFVYGLLFCHIDLVRFVFFIYFVCCFTRLFNTPFCLVTCLDSSYCLAQFVFIVENGGPILPHRYDICQSPHGLTPY